MNTSTYRALSKTGQGRKQSHEMMLEDVKKRIDKFVNEAPESTREKASQLMQTAFEKISKLGNGMLFDCFADDQVSDRNFLLYVNDILKGELQ